MKLKWKFKLTVNATVNPHSDIISVASSFTSYTSAASAKFKLFAGKEADQNIVLQQT